MHEEKPTGKLDPKQEASLDRQIEQAKPSYMPSIVRHEDDGSATEMTLVERSEINSLRHDLEVAEHDRLFWSRLAEESMYFPGDVAGDLHHGRVTFAALVGRYASALLEEYQGHVEDPDLLAEMEEGR